MPNLWTWEIENTGGDTNTTNVGWGALRWSEATVTLRRRAPHEISVTIPRAGPHRLGDFTPWRELRCSLNGVPWLAGFQGGAGLPEGSASGAYELLGWGNAAAFWLARNFMGWNVTTPIFLKAYGPGSGTGVGAYAHTIIGEMLDACSPDRSAGSVKWFPSAYRTIGTAGSQPQVVTFAGLNGLDVIQQACDYEGWAWRAGVDSSGNWTFKASGTVEQDLTGSLRLYDGANCRIVAYRPDALRMATRVYAASRYPDEWTREIVSVVSVTEIDVENTRGVYAGDDVTIEPSSAADRETLVIDSLTSTRLTFTTPMVNTHAARDEVKLRNVGGFRWSSSAGSITALEQAHHSIGEAIYNNQVNDIDQRQNLAEAEFERRNHPWINLPIVITDAGMVEAMLTAGLLPGDSIKLTSCDPDLGTLYADTTVVVQEMRLTMRADGPTTIEIQVGDPWSDDLDVLLRRQAAADNAAKRAY